MEETNENKRNQQHLLVGQTWSNPLRTPFALVKLGQTHYERRSRWSNLVKPFANGVRVSPVRSGWMNLVQPDQRKT
jgi:hypothetical protein